MKYKMVVTDLDDTLLRDDHTISDENKNAIKKAVEKGVYVIFASGRATPPVKMFMEMIDLKLPLISYNGANIVDVTQNEIIYKQELTGNDALPIIKLAQEKDLNFYVYYNDVAYVNKWNDNTNEYVKFSKNVKMELVNDFSPFLNRDITKIIVQDEHEKLLKAKPDFEKVISKDINTFITKPYFLEFTNKHGTKGQALKYLSESLGVNQEEIIAIGDSYNDISMIEYAGLGVCVANGFEDVKKAAQYITLTNEENGVAHVINKFTN